MMIERRAEVTEEGAMESTILPGQAESQVQVTNLPGQAESQVQAKFSILSTFQGEGWKNFLFFSFNLAKATINALIPLFILAGSVLGDIFQIMFLGLVLFIIMMLWYQLNQTRFNIWGIRGRPFKADFLACTIYNEFLRENYTWKIFLTNSMFFYSFFLVYINYMDLQNDENNPQSWQSVFIIYVAFLIALYQIANYEGPYYIRLITRKKVSKFSLKIVQELALNVPLDFKLKCGLFDVITDSGTVLGNIMTMCSIISEEQSTLEKMKVDERFKELPWNYFQDDTSTDEITRMHRYFRFGVNGGSRHKDIKGETSTQTQIQSQDANELPHISPAVSNELHTTFNGTRVHNDL